MSAASDATAAVRHRLDSAYRSGDGDPELAELIYTALAAIEAEAAQGGGGGGGVPDVPWTPYTPTWTNLSGVDTPVLGDGTLTGASARVGRTIHYWVSLVFGATTTTGSVPFDPLTFTLPVPASPGWYSDPGRLNDGLPVGSASVTHPVSIALTPAVCFLQSDGVTFVMETQDSGGTFIDGPGYFSTPEPGASMKVNGTYEAADAA